MDSETTGSLIPEQESIAKTMAGLQKRGFDPVLVPDGDSALEYLKQMIPAGAEVMNGDSTTLKEIGLTDLLKSNKHPWQNWRERIFAEEKDFPCVRLGQRVRVYLADEVLAFVKQVAERR